MAIQDNDTSSSSRKQAPLATKWRAPVLNTVASTSQSEEYELDCSFMDRGIYYRQCYSSSQVTLKLFHLKHDTYLIKTRNRTYEVRFWVEGD